MLSSRRLQVSAVTGAALLATALSGCGTAPAGLAPDSSSQQPDAPATSAAPSSSASTPTPTPTTPPVKFSPNVKNGANSVAVDTMVSVKAAGGTMNKVTLAYAYVDRQGKKQQGSVRGALNKAKTAWRANDRLEPSGSYKLTMVGKNVAKQSTTSSSTFKTQALTLSQQTFPTLYPLGGMKVGVGMPVILTFDVAIKDKKSIQRNLHVSSSPAQVGTWRWYSDREVHFRPKNFWQPGTKITVNADLNSVRAGGGIYGQNSTKTSFTVGDSMVTKVNLASHTAKVYRNGKLARTVSISAGKTGWQTRSGIKLIMGLEYTHKMTNEMIGAKEDYDLNVHYAMRITNSGEFLHAAPWNAGYFGRTNASHGCVGMSTGDAAWIYNRAHVGDPVITTGSSRGLEAGNGYTDWNASYAVYKKGSAL